MEKRRQPLIDSITIPLSASSPLYAIRPFTVTLCCPPNDSTVGVNFTANGTYEAPDTKVISCTLGITESGPITNSMGNWSAPFSNLTPDKTPQTLTATGNNGGEDQHIDIIVSSKGVTPVCRCVTIRNNPGKAVTKPMVQSLTFRGRFPVNAFGKPKPLSLAGMVPAAFTVGGPDNPKNRVNKCTIDNEVTDVLIREGDRWSVSFSKLSAGMHTLQLRTEDGTTETHEIEIDICPDEPAAAQENALS